MSHQEAIYDRGRSEGRAALQVRSTAGTAKLLDCSVRTIYRLVDRGELRPVRLGRVLRFELDEIERYLERHRKPVASP